MKLGKIILVINLVLFFQVNYPSTALAEDKEVKVKPKDKRILVRKDLVGDAVAITDEHSPLHFVNWALWDVIETGSGGKQIVPWSRLETNSISSKRPFEIEIRFEQKHDKESVSVQITGGLKPVKVEARKTEDPKVYRTRAFILVPSSHENDEARRQSEMTQVQAELNELEDTRLPDLEKEIRKLTESYEKLDDELNDLFMANKDESDGYYQGEKNLKQMQSDITSKFIEAVEAKTQIVGARQRLENLKNGNNIFLDFIHRGPIFSDFVQGLPAIDGAILRASYGENRAEAEASIFDYAVDIKAPMALALRCPEGPEPPLRPATNGGVFELNSGFVLTVDATVHVIGSYKGERQPRLVLTVPGTDIRDSREIPEIGSGNSDTITFEFDTASYAWKFDRVVERLPEKNWDKQFVLPETENWAKRLEGKRYPLLIELAVQILGGDCQRWNDKGVVGLIFQKTAILEEILCYIKREAKRRAEGNPPTIAQSKFFEILKTEFLADYLDNPNRETGEEAAEEIGGGQDKIGLYVLKSIRNKYEDMPECLYPATQFFLKEANPIILDTEFLIGEDNLEMGVDADVRGGGRNRSNAMHWGTGVKYSNLPPNGLRELFLGYELWHLEGWDVFGEDALNDLIAEEQGRLFGRRLQKGVISDEAELVREMDAAFQEARAWVGSLLRNRQEELDRLILAPKNPIARKWWKQGKRYPPWMGPTITSMIDEGRGVDEIKESTLVQRLIQIYQLIYEADIWQERTGRLIELTQVMWNMAKGKYNSQFKYAADTVKDQHCGIWELDPDRLD